MFLWEECRFAHCKGQLISKGLFAILNSSKKRMKQFDLTTMIPQVDLFSFVFWKKLKTPKRHFEINWPLIISESHQTISRWLLTASDQKGGNLVVSHSLYQRKPATKGQLILKGVLMSSISSKKRTKEFDFTTHTINSSDWTLKNFQHC